MNQNKIIEGLTNAYNVGLSRDTTGLTDLQVEEAYQAIQEAIKYIRHHAVQEAMKVTYTQSQDNG